MLSKRLKAVYDLVDEGCIVADIGTDHGKLPCELVLSNKAIKAYASDLREGPLQQARKTIKEFGLKGKVLPLLGAGIEEVPDDCNLVTIAGMGWLTCEEILNNDLDRLYKMKSIVIQVNREPYCVRRWIAEHHFTIVDEKLVYDGHYYIIIKFNTDYHEVYSDLQVLLGPCLMEERSQLFIEYLEYLLLNLEDVLRHMPEDNENYNNLRLQAQIINSILA